MTLSKVSCLMLFGFSLAPGQLLMRPSRPGEPIRLLPSDAAILEGRQPRTDLPCEVKPTSPTLEYDLSYHAGYQITIPFQALAGSGDTLTSILQVTPEGREDSVYFSQKWTVPPIEDSVRGDVSMQGTIVLGEGIYQIAWLMRDRAEHFCASFWQVSTLRRGKDRDVTLHAAPGTVGPLTKDLFREEGRVQRNGERPLTVQVLLHATSQSVGAAAMGPAETEAIVAILRHIAREPRFARFSITVFNIDRRAVIFREKDADGIPFPALGTALKDLHLGTMPIQALADKQGGTRFLTNLLTEEMDGQKPDLLLIVGPRSEPDESSVRGFLKQLPDPACPVFYLNYSLDAQTNPWRDLLSSVVRFWHGIEYTICTPRDLFLAWSGVMSRFAPKPAKDSRSTTASR